MNLPIPDVIPGDVACVSCGYNLRSLASSANCPECGQPVMRTVGNPLIYADQNWLERVRSGAKMLAWARPAWLAYSIVTVVFAAVCSPGLEPVPALILLGTLTMWIVLWAGLIEFTSEAPFALGGHVRLLRSAACLGPALVAAEAVCLAATREAARFLAAALVATLLLLPMAAASRAKRLAGLAGGTSTAWLHRAAQVLAVSSVISFGVFLFAATVCWSRVRSAAFDPCWGYLSAMGVSLAVVLAAMETVLMFRVARLLRRARILAEALAIAPIAGRDEIAVSAPRD